ncbi:MAG: EamA family transporter RarD, partial [Gemmataceae bacterium]|nr:EamA family transporter RarD [Gemmataceae bacterium]
VLGKWRELAKALLVPRTRWLLLASTVFIAVNWFIFLHGIETNRAMQGSLGYFINPLFNAVLGVLLLGEQLRRAQVLALGVATAGIGFVMVASGELPWIALGVASSFALYGLVRKLAPVDGLVGLGAETLLLAPLSAALLGWMLGKGEAEFLRDGTKDAMLAASGVLTVLPLWFFVLAAKRLTLTALGFLQYIGPTLQLITAVFVFGEELTAVRLVGFVAVWAGLVMVTAETLLRRSGGASLAERARGPVVRTGPPVGIEQAARDAR